MISNRVFISVLFFSLIVCVTGMVMIPLMDIDAAQYASISREMIERKTFLQFYDIGKDYLDKPPMLFWLSSLSMRTFGIHDWAYRLPSLFFATLAVYSVYRFTLLYYHKTVAQLSAIVLASSQAIFLITHDVRCDTMLMGWVMLSIWQLAAWYQSNKWKYFFVAFIAIAGGMMTKGPIALIVPVLAFVPHFILRREWKQFFRWEYLLGLLIIAVLLIPMSVGLYIQYDMHPGKLIMGVPIQSGLRFYYWTQSFGRYTGENVFHEMSYFTFLLENMLWSFLPWILFFLVALLFSFKDIILNRFWLSSNQEWISTGGFIFTYCILAKSQAQLPHYIFVVFPLAAIVTAVFLYQTFFILGNKYVKKIMLILHELIFGILWVAAIYLMRIPFKEIPFYVFVLAVLGLLGYIILVFASNKFLKLPTIIVISVYTVIGVNLLLSSNFYPNLLKYQMGNTAADFLNQTKIPKLQTYLLAPTESRALHFYGQHIFAHKKNISELKSSDFVITSTDSLNIIQTKFPRMKILHKGADFGVSMLSKEFLDPFTREQTMAHYAIIQLEGTP